MRHASEPSNGSSEQRRGGIGNGYLLPFALIHLGAVAALVQGVSVTGVVLARLGIVWDLVDPPARCRRGAAS